jgi:ribonuclease HI
MGLKRLVIQGLAKGTTVNQLQGNYGVKNKRLKPLFDKIEKLMKQELDECEVWGIATDQVKGVQQLAKKYLELGTSVGFDFFLQEQANSDQDSVRDNARQSDVVGPKNNSVQEYDVVPEETFHGMIPPTLSPDKQYVLRFDGGSRGNPGVSGAGIAIYDLESGDEVWAAFQYLGETTNNVAEYNALLSGLELARSMGITRLIAEGDSTLVVKQVSGEYEVKSKHLIDLNQRVKRIAESFQSFSLQYIPRAENFRADKLANVAMDERISMGLEVSTTNPTRYDDTEGRYDITYSDTKDFRIQPMSIEASPSLSTTNVLSLIPEPLLSERQLSAFRTFVLRFGGKKKGESSIGSASLLIDDLSNEEIWAGTYFKHENVNQFIPAYIGLIIGLRKAMAMGVTRLIVESHIEFVIQQMAGKWSVKSKAIQPYYEVAKNLIDNYFEDVDFQLIDSNNNNAVKDMIDEAIISHKTQLPGFK